MTEVSDVITLRGLSAVGQHGVFDFERSGSQVFSADLTLHIDSRLAAQTDDVQYTVDYGEIADAAVHVLTGPPVYLLETLAHNLAVMALQNPLVRAVDVTIHKPMAPVRHQFTDVSVTISRTRETLPTAVELAEEKTAVSSSSVVLSVGSNRGDSIGILTRTVAALIELPGIEIEDVSPLVVTKPVLAKGQAPQPDYLNAIIIARTILAPIQLLEVLQSVEQQFGRTRAERWGARTLDIDIIDYDQRVEELPGLQLPHPRAAQRMFVLYPWSLVAPDATLADGRKVSELAVGAQDGEEILQTRYDWLKDVDDAPRLQSDTTIRDENQAANLQTAPPPTSPESDGDPQADPQEETTAGADSSDPVSSAADDDVPAAPIDVTRVTIRGNPIELTTLNEDTLFQRLLQKENFPKRTTPKPEMDLAGQTVPEPEAEPGTEVRPPAVVNPTFSPKTEPSVFPTRRGLPRRVDRDPHTPAHAQSTLEPELPDWRFVGGTRTVRIIDSADGGFGQSTHSPLETPRDGIGRRRVYRPTPTGMIPLATSEDMTPPSETHEGNV